MSPQLRLKKIEMWGPNFPQSKESFCNVPVTFAKWQFITDVGRIEQNNSTANSRFIEEVNTKAGTNNQKIDLLIDKFLKNIIVTDLLIIDHLISTSVTLLYLPLVFRHLNYLPYFI